MGGNVLKTAKYHKMSGKDADGLWFRATLRVTVPQTAPGAPGGTFPILLSLEKRKVMRRPPRAASHLSGFPTIFEELGDASASDTTISSNSCEGQYQRAQPRSEGLRSTWNLQSSGDLQASYLADSTGASDSREAGQALPEPIPWSLNMMGPSSTASDDSRQSSSTLKPHKPRRRILISL
mmetsp:Transcript_75902/g.197473  ORF Transcript_75902/g.197473 Transcript_75902/m.197473 type:complete len:180 (+) Transcript_75902:286-825(+)